MQGPTRRNYWKQVSEGDGEEDTFFDVHLLFYQNPFPFHPLPLLPTQTAAELSHMKEVKSALHCELQNKDIKISEIRIVESGLRIEIQDLKSALECQAVELQYRRDAATADATERASKSRKNGRAPRDSREEVKLKLVR